MVIDSVAYSSVTGSVYAFGPAEETSLVFRTPSETTGYSAVLGNLVRFNGTTMALQSGVNIPSSSVNEFNPGILSGGQSRMLSPLGTNILGGGKTSGGAGTHYGIQHGYRQNVLIFNRFQSALEVTDSSGLYVGGPFVFNGDELAPFFVRVDLTTGALND
jgi:hypothetical protein